MKRYIVIEVGCLECQAGRAEPTVVLITDDPTEAESLALQDHGSDVAYIIVDRDEGVVSEPTVSPPES